MKLLRIATLGLALALLSPWLSAQSEDDSPLEWENTYQRFTTDLGQEQLQTAFRFTNTSDEPVTIVGAHASCGCTIPKLQKDIYQPGESGEVDVLFELGSRVGMQHKVVEVQVAQDETETAYSLTLEVEIPEAVKISPRVRFWKLNEAPESMEFKILLHDTLPMKITGIVSKDGKPPADFDYTVTTVVENKEYRVTVTPHSTTEKSRDVLLLTSDEDEQGFLAMTQFYVYVR